MVDRKEIGEKMLTSVEELVKNEDKTCVTELTEKFWRSLKVFHDEFLDEAVLLNLMELDKPM